MKKATKKSVNKQANEPVQQPEYSAKIKVLGKFYTSAGSSVKEVIENLQVPRGRGMAILTVYHGQESKDRILPAPQTTRLFSLSPLMREIAIKQISLMFSL